MTQHRPLSSFCALVFLLLFTSSIAHAAPQAPDSFMLKDINTDTANSYPNNFVAFNGLLYFDAVDKVNGGSLWKSDGTEAGTQLVKSILPTFENNSGIKQIRTTSDQIFLLAASPDGIYGDNQLFRSDGTSEGTMQITGVFTSVSMMDTTNTLLFFAANDAEHGRELWRTDGTQAGTFRISDINAGIQDSLGFGDAWAVGDALYFAVGTDTFPNQKLWISDGTQAGTHILKNTSPDTASLSLIQDVRKIGNTIYFTTYYSLGSESFNELWKTNGTEAGTVRIKQILLPSNGSNTNPTYAYANLHQYNNSSFFIMLYDIGQLWASDGTESGTTLLIDQNARLGFTSASDGNTFYFVGNTFETGSELWKSDGTITGTIQVADILTGTESGVPADVGGALTIFQNKLYFAADDGLHGFELWQTDGSSQNTTLFQDINPFEDGSEIFYVNPVVIGNQMFFAAYDPPFGMELWRTDGTQEGTRLVKDINHVETGDACPAGFTQTDNGIFFTAQQIRTGFELWKIGATQDDTTTLGDFRPGSRSGIYNLLGGAGEFVYFIGAPNSVPNDVPHLYASDGTITGTAVVTTSSILPNAPDPLHKQFAAYAGNFYLLYQLPFDGGPTQFALYQLDGTKMVEVHRFDYIDTYQYRGMVEANGLLYFHANGAEIWRTDGTNAGTIHIGNGPYLDIATLAGKTYFISSGGLWKTDGTEAGTVQVKTINGSTEIAATDTHIYVMGTDGLWQSDGTEAGTKLISGKIGSKLHAAGSHVYFIIPAASQGDPTELWGSDGTSPGTKRLQTIPASLLYQFTAYKNQLFFVAQQSNPLKKALWTSDGTITGTMQVEDLRKKIDDNSADCGAVIFATAERLYYTGNDGIHGIELWVYGENPTVVETTYEQFLPLVVR